MLWFSKFIFDRSHKLVCLNYILVLFFTKCIGYDSLVNDRLGDTILSRSSVGSIGYR
jgi:hypothetical protein